RLPVGVRYPAVAAVGAEILVAGGVGPAGTLSTVYAFDTRTGRSRLVARLPTAVGHAAAVALGRSVFVLGGRDASGRTVGDVVRVDLRRGAATPAGTTAPIADAAVVTTSRGALLIGGERGGSAVADVRAVSLR